MDRTDLVRLRWRLSGAWFWPTFAVLSLVDAVVGVALPVAGDSETAVGAWLVGTVLMLLAVCLISPGLGFVLRRLRRDLPRPVARNYAMTFLALAVSAALLGVGLAHHHSISTDRAAMIDASERAKAWIGDHAPAKYMGDLNQMSLLPIEAPQIYRACVLAPSGSENYCVVVNRDRPFGSSVRYDGHESNELLGNGTE